MNISIDGRLRLFNFPEVTNQWFIERLTFPNPQYEDAKKNGRRTYGIPQFITMYDLLPNGIVVPRGFLQSIEESLLNTSGVTINDNRVLFPSIDYNSEIVLRPYQIPPVKNLLTHPQGMLIAPAGSGKTIMGLHTIATLRQKALWITHTHRLASQAEDRMRMVFNNLKDGDIAHIGAGKWNIGNKITIGMVQTLVRNLHKLPEIGREFGVVIVDEAHHVPASIFVSVLEHMCAYYMYGLTATPYRRDKLESVMFATLGRPNGVISRNIVCKNEGIITPKAILKPIRHPEWGGNDHNEILREAIMPNEYRLNTIVNDVVGQAMLGHYCLVVSTRKQYCEELYKRILMEWNKVGIATGDYTKKQNDIQVKRLEDDEITVLCTTPDLLGEGFDVPKLDRGFITLPFRERTIVEQVVGRIQRPSKETNKLEAIVFDYIDYGIGVSESQARSRQYVYRYLGMNIEHE